MATALPEALPASPPDPPLASTSVIAAQQAVLVALRAVELAARGAPAGAGPVLATSGADAAHAALAAARAGGGTAGAQLARLRAVRLHAAAAAATGAASGPENALVLTRVRLFLAPRAPGDALEDAMAALAAELAVAGALRERVRRTRPVRQPRRVCKAPTFSVVFPVPAWLVQCAICLAAYAHAETAACARPCGHAFHAECLERYVDPLLFPSPCEVGDDADGCADANECTDGRRRA